MGSLTGAVASQIVTEAYKGWLVPDGNRNDSAKAYASLTVRPTSRADGKPGFSELLHLCDLGSNQRIKVTPGITG